MIITKENIAHYLLGRGLLSFDSVVDGDLLGLAGVGHFYLHLHDPVGVPSVLIILPEEAVSSEQ